SDYYQRVGYSSERFEPTGFDNLVQRGRVVFDSDPAHWEAAMFTGIDRVAQWSRATGLGLYTSECWVVVDYKDWPGLEWDWVKDTNAKAVARAAATGRWVGIATSNFCAPQFVEMWRDINWHRRLTGLITTAHIDADLHRGAPTP
ncbi:MAG: cellulase-like family protein, partial [Arachnia sp.]